MRIRADMRGFTLMELMIVVAVIGILTAVAIPSYNGYMKSTRENVAKTNLGTLKLAEEAYWFDNNKYAPGTYDPAGGTDTLTGTVGWKPNQDGNKYVYVVGAGTCGNTTNCYNMTASYNGTVLATETRDR